MNKQTIEENRRKLKEIGITEYLIRPMVEYWKEKPLKAIGIFLSYAILYYAIFVIIQATMFSFTYCETNIGLKGPLMETYPQFVEKANQRTTELRTQGIINGNTLYQYANYTKTNNLQQTIKTIPKWNITCNYNITKWYKENTTTKLKIFGNNLYKVGIKKWSK